MRYRKGQSQKALLSSTEEEQKKEYVSIEEVDKEDRKEQMHYARERGPTRESVRRFKNIFSYFFVP